ncbi:hypothetical protein HQ520_03985, partial [bacterium]|nr:hypothetical protein [bacterium]
YSVESHWEVVKRVTGIEVDLASPPEKKAEAQKAFFKTWNYDFYFACHVTRAMFGEKKTSMGHAVYAAGGVDCNDHIQSPFQTPEDVLNFDIWKEYGLRDKKEMIRGFEEHYRRNCENRPDGVNMTGVYVTCVSGLIDIFGWDMLLLAAGVDPKGFGELTDRYCSWVNQYFEALAEADVPAVMIHDDIVWTSGPFIHPDWYRNFVFKNYKKMWAPVIESGKRVTYCSDGDYTMFVDDIAACGAQGFVMEPVTDMAYVAEKYGKTHAFVGNADTRILLRGTKEDIRAEVERCMRIGKSCPGFFMAVGNHIPANTPVENVLYYNDVYEKMSKR